MSKGVLVVFLKDPWRGQIQRKIVARLHVALLLALYQEPIGSPRGYCQMLLCIVCSPNVMHHRRKPISWGCVMLNFLRVEGSHHDVVNRHTNGTGDWA